MKRWLLILAVIVTIGEGRTQGQALDVPILASLQQLVGLATSQQSLDWSTANNIYMNMYYSSQTALDMYRSIQNQMESLRYQVKSLQGQGGNFDASLAKVDQMLATYAQMRSNFQTMQIALVGGESVSLPDAAPARGRLQDIKQAKDQLANLRPYAGESPVAYQRRVSAALDNLRRIWTRSEKVEQSLAKDILTLSTKVSERYDVIREASEAFAEESKTESSSVVAQLQIVNKQLSRVIVLLNDMAALSGSQAAHAIVASERVEQYRAEAEALSANSTQISTPDTSALERQIQSSGISINDLTGVTTPNGAFDFNKQW